MYCADYGRPRGAHCVYYEAHKGNIPDGCQVHHKCQNKLCVNPDHLVALSRSEHQLADYQMGCRSKVTPTQVEEIREMFAGGTKQKVIATQFGITQSNVSRIVNHKSWERTLS